MRKSDSTLIAELLHVYSYQEIDEQIHKTTAHQNGKGFNSIDASILSSIAEYFLKNKYLSEKQLAIVKSKMKKYSKQIPTDLQPVEIKIQWKSKKKMNIKEAVIENDLIKISFPFDRQTLANVKTLYGRKWNADKKYWACPIDADNIKNLIEWGFGIDEKLLNIIKENQEIKLKDIKIPGIKKELYSYQKKGVNFIDLKGGNALIADEMGLGKTAQALGFLQLHPKNRPALIVCPATLKLNWKKEIKIWMSKKCSIHIFSGKPNGNVNIPKADIYIINYDILANKQTAVEGKKKKVDIPFTGWSDHLAKLKINTIIMDESHLIKNPKALRTKSLMKLAKKIKHVIALSGTPIVNRPVELYNSIRLVNPKLFPSRWDYLHRYCGAKHNGFGWDFNGSSNTQELHNKLCSSIMIRRLKKDVLTELPEKIRSVVPMEIDNRNEYDNAEGDFISFLQATQGKEKAEKAEQAETLVKIEALKQIAVNGKIKSCINWIDNYLEQEDKLVIFCTHKNVVDSLMKNYKGKIVKIDGSVSSNKREEAVERFQTDNKIKLFVGNIKAAGVGITLTAAKATCTIELGWTSGEHDQAEDRVHRIGQTADSVYAYYLIAVDTIEESISEMIDVKRNVLSQVLDGKDVESDSLFTELLTKYKG